MTNKIQKTFEDAIEAWRINKGVGTIVVRPPFNDLTMLLSILQRLYNKSPTIKGLIVVNDFADRRKIVEYLTTQEDEENNNTFKRLINEKTIKILTKDFIDNVYTNEHSVQNLCGKYAFFYRPDNIIMAHKAVLAISAFKLVLFNKPNVELCNKLNIFCPLLNVFTSQDVDELRVTLPVEETRLPISIDEDSEDYITIQEYNNYISTSLHIFGSFDNMNAARIGDTNSGTSAAQYCFRIAQENGWSPTLDMSVGINIEIDNLYNPNALRERANLTYDIIRKRSRLLASNDAKLEQIYKVVSRENNKKVLIINKFADFASKVTDYLNSHSDTDICANYHDKIEPTMMKDSNGNYICYKSGAKKGQPRIFGAQVQKSANESMFNNNIVRCLSTNGAPDKDLKLDGVDIVIITSPQCEAIKSYLYRLSKVRFTNNFIVLYSLYCSNTMEEKMIEQKEIGENHSIVNNVEKQIIDTNNADVIIVD